MDFNIMPIQEALDTFEPTQAPCSADMQEAIDDFAPTQEPKGFVAGFVETLPDFASIGAFSMTRALEVAAVKKKLETPGAYDIPNPLFAVGPLKFYARGRMGIGPELPEKTK